MMLPNDDKEALKIKHFLYISSEVQELLTSYLTKHCTQFKKNKHLKLIKYSKKPIRNTKNNPL